jgi:hypothetical protein
MRMWNPNSAWPALNPAAISGRPATSSSGTSRGWMATSATTMPAMLAKAPNVPISPSTI